MLELMKKEFDRNKSKWVNTWMIMFFGAFIIFLMSGVNPVCAGYTDQLIYAATSGNGPLEYVLFNYPSSSFYDQTNFERAEYHFFTPGLPNNTFGWEIASTSNVDLKQGTTVIYHASLNQNTYGMNIYITPTEKVNNPLAGYDSFKIVKTSGTNLGYIYQKSGGMPAGTLIDHSTDLGVSGGYGCGASIGSGGWSRTYVSGAGVFDTNITSSSPLDQCHPAVFYVNFMSSWDPLNVKDVDFTLKDSGNNIIIHTIGKTYTSPLNISAGLLSPGGYNAAVTVIFGGSSYYASQGFTVLSNCTGSGYLPNVTPTITQSAWTNNTSWQNLTFPPGTWVIGNYTLIPLLPWNMTNFSFTNRTDIYNYFNQTLLPPGLVNSYFNLIDSLINRILAAILSILAVLLMPLIMLGNSINVVSNLLLQYLNAMLAYLHPIAIIFQTIIYILPPVIIYAGTVCLIIAFAWWVLYGRK